MSTNFNNVNASQAHVAAFVSEQGYPVNQARFEDPGCMPLEDLK